MPSFLVVTMQVHNASWREDYRANVPAILDKFGGEYLVATPQVEVVEGNAVQPDMGAILKFPDLPALQSFLSCDEYKPYRHARLNGSEGIFYAFTA